MGHKYISTNINSYINPERKGLNFNEEENNFKASGIEALKKIESDNKKIKESYSELDEREDSFNLEDEGEDYIDDDFDIYNF